MHLSLLRSACCRPKIQFYCLHWKRLGIDRLEPVTISTRVLRIDFNPWALSTLGYKKIAKIILKQIVNDKNVYTLENFR
jgi:hypothetical protein